MTKGVRRNRYWSDPAFRAVFRIVFWYTVFGVLWILVSDQAVRLLFTTPELMTRVSMIKGWAYVVFTALGLFVLLLASIRRLRRSASEAATYFSSTPAVMEVCGNDLTLETINEAGLSLYGRSLQRLQETDWIAQVIAPDDQQALRSLMHRALERPTSAVPWDAMTIHVVANPSEPRTLVCRVSASRRRRREACQSPPHRTRHHRPGTGAGTAQPCREAGIDRAACRRGRPRLQQLPLGHPGAAVARQSRPG